MSPEKPESREKVSPESESRKTESRKMSPESESRNSESRKSESRKIEFQNSLETKRRISKDMKIDGYEDFERYGSMELDILCLLILFIWKEINLSLSTNKMDSLCCNVCDSDDRKPLNRN